jgi:anti-sigma factor RsiW
MRRSRLETLLHDYVAGDLDQAARDEVERLLARDAEARALLEEVRGAHEALTSLRDRPEPPVTADQILPAIQAAIAGQRYERRPQLYLEGQGTRFHRRLALAATVLFAGTVALLLTSRGPGEGPVADTGPAATEVVEREISPFTEMDAEKLFEMLERKGLDPEELPRYVPTSTVIPIGDGSIERR